jgi:uncharacterized protein (DUF2132 family)
MPSATMPKDDAVPPSANRPAPTHHPRDPLHGITLEKLLTQLVARHGWAEMGRRIPVRCFLFDPSINSSLKFLRKTPWARKRVEDWFIHELPPPSEAHPPRPARA